MNRRCLGLVAALLLSGCATSTIETRKQERYAAYAELPAEQKAAADSGQLKVGMPVDAVYIAWGKPSQVVAGESSKGATVTWLYYSSYLQAYPYYWSYPGYCYGFGHFPPPYFTYDYYPRSYVRAEVIFEGNKVAEWRTLPHPGY
jgi:hypothetical protein